MNAKTIDPAADLLAVAGRIKFGTVLADLLWRLQNRIGVIAPGCGRLKRSGASTLDDDARTFARGRLQANRIAIRKCEPNGHYRPIESWETPERKSAT